MIKILSAVEFENASSRSRAEPVEVWKARKFIEEHSVGPLSLRRVAKAVNIHPNYLSEKFKHVTGINFVEYVSRTRFQRAHDLLQNSDLSVTEIAFAAGFQSNKGRSTLALSRYSARAAEEAAQPASAVCKL